MAYIYTLWPISLCPIPRFFLLSLLDFPYLIPTSPTFACLNLNADFSCFRIGAIKPTFRVACSFDCKWPLESLSSVTVAGSNPRLSAASIGPKGSLSAMVKNREFKVFPGIGISVKLSASLPSRKSGNMLYIASLMVSKAGEILC